MDAAILKQVAEELIPFNKFLGVQATLIERGRAVLEIPWRDELVGDPLKPAMHGGVMSMLADAAGGLAIWTMLENVHIRLSTIDLRVDYLRPGRLERICAEATTVRVGRSVGVADVRLYHPTAVSETIATGKGVYAIKHPRPKAE
jgi:uncharacterized protein (TIGR00369 family)